MKTKVLFITILIVSSLLFLSAKAEQEERSVPAFSKISLRISANVHVEQGAKQNVRVEAKSSVLEDLITEVKDRTLIIRLPNNFLFQSYNTGKIDIYITVPEIDGLVVSGSGNIITENVSTRILDLTVSGSGNIKIEELRVERVTATISGSGGIAIDDGGIADNLNVTISGSGNLKASDFEANDVNASISGSGNCSIKSNGSIKARIAGSGSVYYSGNPSIDSSVAGSGKVRKQ
ncbi:MAG: DUF2807 domain-containing protein [Prolixibacteraceae bacterium]|nr:DUF2807 domain-containing protein [Prolixibacteraceae bacterium]